MLNRDEIKQIIPIQPPVLAVDRITDIQVASSVIGELDVREDAWWARAHFPGSPILPGTQIIESMAQVDPFCFYDEAKPRSI